jgi:hypothetical protein
MGVGLVDLLRTVARTGSGLLLCLGLSSKASMILWAALRELLKVGVREDDDGGTGVTGSDGSGKVLERFLAKDRGGGFTGNALGGEVESRTPGLGLMGYGPEILSGSGLVRVEGSNVGDGADRFGGSRVGD